MLLSTPGQLGTLTPVIGSMGRALSLKQLPNGAFFIGGGWPGDTTPDIDPAVKRRSKDYVRRSESRSRAA